MKAHYYYYYYIIIIIILDHIIFHLLKTKK